MRKNQDSYVRTDWGIRARTVRLIGPEGENLGVVPIEKARQKSEEFGLNLIEISPSANPPVCKIMDFGKYKYEVARKKRETKNKTMEFKEIRLRPGTDDHDLSIKLQRAREFLADGSRVTFTIKASGREIEKTEFINEMINKIKSNLVDCSKIFKDTYQMGRRYYLILESAPNGKPKKLEGGPNAEKEDSKGSDKEIKGNQE